MIKTRVVALDCEMVGAVDGESMAARVAIVNEYNQVLLDKYIKPWKPVGDYRTIVSGISPLDLIYADSLYQVQTEVSNIISGRILVGHSLDKDLQALRMEHPKASRRDLALFPPFIQLNRGHPASLKLLAKKLLGRTIQEGQHSPVEDAKASLDIYLKVASIWHTFSG